MAVKAGGIHVYLVFGHDIHAGGAGGLATGALPEREVFVLAGLLVVYRHQTADSCYFQQLLNLVVVTTLCPNCFSNSFLAVAATSAKVFKALSVRVI